MKQMLTKNEDIVVNVPHKLRGKISNLYGEISPNLRGDISGIQGDCTNIFGNLDDCKLTNEDRKNGIDIKNLLK